MTESGEGREVEFRILGPVEVREGGTRHQLGSRKERCVLAVLLWELGHPVAGETIIDRVWGDGAPDKVFSSLYSAVSRLRGGLRRASGEDRAWIAGAGWYTLETSREDVDLYRFRDLRDEARSAIATGADERAFGLLREAERLWHGVPLGGLEGVWAEGVRAALDEERYEAATLRLDAGIRSGHHAELVGELVELTAQRPLAEKPAEYLMRALYRSGRGAEALQVYPRFHRNYVAEMGGSESSAALRHLHEQMLGNDPVLDVTPPAKPAATVTRPAALGSTLPRDNPDFTGRATELNALAGWVNSGEARSAVPVIVISGMPGIGKTALAVHAAHVFGDRYDRRLSVELRGHSPDRDPVDPATALGTLLHSLGVVDKVIPGSIEDRAALWRSRLAGKRALILLDDAVDSSQVKPLLPGAAGCLVLITTRRKAIDLPGVRWLPMHPLPPAEAAALFVRSAGEDRRDDPAGVASVLRLCGYVPQEIQFAARELRRHPAWSVWDLETRLRETSAENSEVGAALELSYRHLTAAQQRLLRQLALHPEPGFSRHAADAMAGDQAISETQHALDVLLDYHLIEEPVTDRFAFHDLIKKHARRLAERHDSEADQDLAMERLLDYYLCLADRADRVAYPFHRRMPAPVRNVPVAPAPFLTRYESQQWMAAERPALLAIARYAAAHGHTQHAGLLPHVLAKFLDAWGYWADAAELHGHAVTAWRAAGNRAGEAKALTELSLILARTGRHDEALRHAGDALTLARAAADHAAEADALDRMGIFLWWLARYPEALAHFDEALTIWRALDDRDGEADTLMYSGIAAWHLSRYPEALHRTERALALYRELGDAQGEANALNNLGALQEDDNHYEQALASYGRALEMFRDLGDRQGEAIAVSNIGEISLKTGRSQDALTHYRVALAIYREIGDLRCETNTLNSMGAAYLHTGRHAAALEHHQKALLLAHQIAERFLTTQSLRGSGGVYLAAGNYALAADDFRGAVALSQQISDRAQEADALRGLGDALLRTDGAAAARACWLKALEIFEDIGRPDEASAARARLGAAESGSDPARRTSP
jgi:tetratricopeptide (TPR) repeat protein/DNA-binding SARP family transcriptional activator